MIQSPSTIKLKLSQVGVALAMLALPVYAQNKSTGKKPNPSAGEDRRPAGEEKEEKEEKKGLQIGKLLPLNKPNLRVKIPAFDEGKLTSMVEAEKLTRIDDVNLSLEDAIIQLISQQLMIRLRTALYNTEGAILSSNQQTTISTKEFTMTGATLDFDTRSGKGRMAGPVRMIIHNLGGMGESKEGAKTTNAKAAGSAANPPEENAK